MRSLGPTLCQMALFRGYDRSELFRGKAAAASQSADIRYMNSVLDMIAMPEALLTMHLKLG